MEPDRRLATVTLAWGAVLRWSGDTDGCEPSWVNGFLFVFLPIAGVALAVVVPLRLCRAAAARPVSWGVALAHMVAGAVVAYSLLDAVLP